VKWKTPKWSSAAAVVSAASKSFEMVKELARVLGGAVGPHVQFVMKVDARAPGRPSGKVVSPKV